MILEEVQNVRPMNSGVGPEVEVLFDGGGSSSDAPQIIQVSFRTSAVKLIK